jgi:protein-tyrosine phosphatase
MRGMIDLHSHWVAGVDDGARTVEDSAALLRALSAAGFERVVATPHMRPGMFDNAAADLRRAYAATTAALAGAPGLPALDLASEHFFDDVVFQRLMRGEALPYPGGHAALVEFPTRAFPLQVAHRFFDLARRGLTPVIAHPERYEPVWKDPSLLDPLIDGGAVLLLDVAALAGKYGRAPRRAAEKLVEAGYYHAACSDAHAAKDVRDVEEGIALLVEMEGADEARFLLCEGPRQILEGRIEPSE